MKKTKSSYYPAFRELYSETSYALDEAIDIAAHIRPLVAHFDAIKSNNFDDIADFVDPMFHTICLLWAHSKYFAKPARIIVLLQEVNNLIMTLANEFVEPITLFKMDPEESLEKISKAVKSLEAYRRSYESHRFKILSYFKNGTPAIDWDFAPQLVFTRFDKFNERLNMIVV